MKTHSVTTDRQATGTAILPKADDIFHKNFYQKDNSGKIEPS
jgi:hypothetical protein